MPTPHDLHRSHCAFCAKEVDPVDVRVCRRCRRTFHVECCDRGHEAILQGSVLTRVCLLCSSGLGIRLPPPSSSEAPTAMR